MLAGPRQRAAYGGGWLWGRPGWPKDLCDCLRMGTAGQQLNSKEEGWGESWGKGVLLACVQEQRVGETWVSRRPEVL